MVIDWNDRISKWYKVGYWTKAMVWDAVNKNKIDQEQYKEITGDNYPTARPTENTSQ